MDGYDHQYRDNGRYCATSRSPSMASGMFTDQDGKPVVGFCLMCGKNYYSTEEMRTHHANDSEACPGYQGLQTADSEQ